MEGMDMNNNIRIRCLYSIIIFVVFAILFVGYKVGHVPNIEPENLSYYKVPSDSPEKIVLEYYIWDDEESYIVPVVNAYNAQHSSVKINLHVLTSVEYDIKINELLLENTKIDLLNIRGFSALIQLQDEEQLLDLTSFIKSNDLDVTAYGSMFNEISVENKYYGLPTRSTCWILVYNKDIFDAANIAYPEQITWDEYRQLAITLTKGQGENKIYGGYWVPWCYNFASIQQNSYLIDDDLTYTRESLEMLNNFYNVDNSHMSYKLITEQTIDCRVEFDSGNIAMMPQGEWFINMLLTDEEAGLTNVNWDIAPIPVFEKQESGITWGQYQFAGITSKCTHPREAFDFIQFLCGEEGARIYAENGMIHAFSNEEIKQIYMNTVGKSSVSIFYNTKKVQEQLAMSGYKEVLDTFVLCAQEYFLGNQTIDETMIDFEKKRSEILK